MRSVASATGEGFGYTGTKGIAMPIDILMPALSPSMEKGTLVQWNKSVGDKVRSGEAIAEVETDKTTVDVVADADGILSVILVSNGTADVPVHVVIGRIALDGESLEVSSPKSKNAAVVTQPETRDAVEAIAMPALPEPHQARRIFASPIAKRLMDEARMDIQRVTGTGPHGRIIQRDVEAALAQRDRSSSSSLDGSQRTPASKGGFLQSANVAHVEEDIRQFFEPGSFDELPHDALRITIARRLTAAKRNIPHFYLAADCAVGKLLRLREELNASMKHIDSEGHQLSINDFVVKAYALALCEVPDANVSYTEDAMLRHRQVDIAMAVAIPGGLVTPIIRHADQHSITTLSAQARDLVNRAQRRKLMQDEYIGGTAGVSNLGMYGVEEFTAIINPPQATILAVGAATRRVMALDDDRTSVDWMMRVTLSVDHRAVDGATAAQLLGSFKRLVENPMGLLIERVRSLNGRSHHGDNR
jgi:pyruvate dehydrogenase E2 component (dihydrolipoamide acetyltransferase)